MKVKEFMKEEGRKWRHAELKLIDAARLKPGLLCIVYVVSHEQWDETRFAIVQGGKLTYSGIVRGNYG